METTEQKVERLERENEKFRNAVRDALALLQPQLKVMNPSLLAVREAVSVLRVRLPEYR